MTRLDRHLVALLGLTALTALIHALPASYAQAHNGHRLQSIPTTLGPWTVGPAVADNVLPVDSRSLESIGWVYEKGPRRLWLSVARYPSKNRPDTRPALKALILERGMNQLERNAVTFSIGGARPIPAIRLSARFSGRTVTAWYWYQLGQRRIGDEYSLRFWLGLNTVLRRDASLFLVRIAAVDDDAPTDFVELLSPHLDKLAALTERE